MYTQDDPPSGATTLSFNLRPKNHPRRLVMATAESHLPPDHPRAPPETTSEASDPSDPTPKFAGLQWIGQKRMVPSGNLT